VVQDAQRFEPDAQEIERAAKNAPPPRPRGGSGGGPTGAMSGGHSGGPFQFSIPAAKMADPAVMEELKALFEDNKGESDVHLVVHTSSGQKKLRFGPQYKVQQSPNLRYEIEQLLGAEALLA
jgi:hypothetical protein